MSGAPLAAFESGMHQAFLASFAVTLVAAVISALRPAHSTAMEKMGMQSQPRSSKNFWQAIP